MRTVPISIEIDRLCRMPFDEGLAAAIVVAQGVSSLPGGVGLLQKLLGNRGSALIHHWQSAGLFIDLTRRGDRSTLGDNRIIEDDSSLLVMAKEAFIAGIIYSK
jgi:hypothetical protein